MHTNRFVVILQALLVTFLWSTSFIIIKIGLASIPALTFAGLRYSLAFLCLLPFALNNRTRLEIHNLTTRDWIKLSLLGIIFYTLTQGAQFLGLSLLPAVTVSLLLNFTPLIVALSGIWLLKEVPTLRQWIGVFTFIIGIVLYFHPVSLIGNHGLGLLVMLIGVLANSGAAVLGRSINRTSEISPLTVTIVSMGIGAGILLATGVTIQGLPPVSLKMATCSGWLVSTQLWRLHYGIILCGP